MPKRKAPDATAPQVNITINNYFGTVQGPTPAPEAGPECLFPAGERRHRRDVPWGKGQRVVWKSFVTTMNVLMAGCTGCINKKCIPIEQFAPPECLHNARKRHKFFQHLDAFNQAVEDGDLETARTARGLVEAYRNDYCPSCQEGHSRLSPGEQACKDEWERMRKQAAAEQDGCKNPNCVERGLQAWCTLQADHGKSKKVLGLSEYKAWPGKGGVEGMREEWKNVDFICAFCHILEKTGNAGNKYEDPASMPDGKRNGTEEEIKQYNRKLKAKIVYPKQQFVDARKRDIGCCELCAREVVAGEEHAFTFDHRDPVTKMIDDPVVNEKTLAGKKGGVSGLVDNHRKRRPSS